MSNWISSHEQSLPSDTIVTAVVGYRIWYIPVERPWLHSWTVIHHQWKPFQRVEAQCLNRITCVSCLGNEGGCNAGIYAFKTKEQAQDEYIDQLEDLVQCCALAAEESIKVPDDPRNRIAVGKVYLWGKVLEHSKGFRGQYAYPSALYNTSPLSETLSEMYRVPLIAFKDYRRT